MTQASTPHLRLEGLVRRFGERVAVDGLDLSVERGEIFGLLGPNGAGKSTTFSLITGLLRPDAGRIFLDGVLAPPTDWRVRRRIGVVFQEPSLDDKLSARENLSLGAALYGIGGDKARKKISDALELVGLADRGHEAVGKFSGGMRRRVEIARVLLHDPELLILDEPSRGVDPATQARIWDELNTLRRERKLTIVVTTHQPDEAERCDRLALLNHGKLIACDTPDALRARVGGDVLELDTSTPELVVEVLRAKFELSPEVQGSLVRARVREGHILIPRVVDAIGADRIHSLSLRRPTLADAFIRLTGQDLAATTDHDDDKAAA